MTKVINYQRVSTGAQDAKRQTFLAKEYCKMYGYELVDIISEQVSGAKTDRKSIDKLLALTNKDCDLVVVSELSRLTREEDYDQIIYYIKTIKKNGIDVCFLDEPTTVYKHDERFTLPQLITLIVKAQGANEELNKIRGRMESGKKAKAAVNPYMVTGSKIPFGFRKVDNPNYVKGKTPKSLLEFDRNEIAALKFIYNMAITGKRSQEIADYLNLNGFLHKDGKKWVNSEITRLLKQKIYNGEREICGITHKIKKIIPDEVFNQTNKCISKKRCIIAKSEHFNPLKGLFYCDCGLPMSVRKLGWKDALTYKCLYTMYYKRHANKQYDKCENGYIYYDKVVSYVYDSCKNFITDSEYYGQSRITIEHHRMQIDMFKDALNKKQVELSSIDREFKKLERNLSNTELDEYILGKLNERAKELRIRREELEAEIKQVMDEIRQSEQDINNLQNDTKVEGLNIHEKSELFNKIIDKVVWKCEKMKRKEIYLTRNLMNIY